MSGGKIGHSEEMNERPKLGTGEGGVNDCFWVVLTARRLGCFLLNPGNRASNLSSRKQPFVQRDHSHFFVLEGQLREGVIGNRLGRQLLWTPAGAISRATFPL